MEYNGELPSQISDSGGEERLGKGLQVVVENPKNIYNALPLHTRDGLEIQQDNMSDSVCSFLTTQVDLHRSPNLQVPDAYYLFSQVHNEGENASISKFTQGYFSEQQIDTLRQSLSQQGCTDIELSNDAHKYVFSFSYANTEYNLDLGFKGPKYKNQWIQRDVEAERFERGPKRVTDRNNRGGYDEPKNENTSLSAYFDPIQNPSVDPYLDFEKYITQYAKVYEMFLKGLYQVHGVEEPDKTLKLTYTQPSPPRLSIIK